jgi:hypothetical protein
LFFKSQYLQAFRKSTLEKHLILFPLTIFPEPETGAENKLKNGTIKPELP